ncbi:putative receptor-like protein kinase At4g00960 [Pistacia vera]|uniref:putative receptor-like protein kinase At4g00960 n=1 Tax=Pistacia vera TaxID=55513 RepID=UPI001263B90D|nr:putative receptor-like protein kinase At4g00960 [Pistacia vera]
MVYMAKLRDQEKPVAVKKLPLYTKKFDQITNEVYAGQKLKHDNLVELLAVFDPNVQGQLNWERRVGICRGIAKGLEYLHELATGKIIHRNIKASKVLLDEDFNAKLSDLGLAMLYDEDEPHDFLQKIAAAVTYMAPEVLKKESVTDKADVFSYGIVLLEIISGQSVACDEDVHGKDAAGGRKGDKRPEGRGREAEAELGVRRSGKNTCF